MFFVNLLFQNELYQKASLELEKAIKLGYIEEDKKSFELLISGYLNAKEYEKAIKKLAYSKLADKYKYKRLLANLYYERQEYKKALNALDKYKTKGEDYILLALCHYELEDMGHCKTNLQKASKFAKAKKRAKNIAKSLRIKL